MGLIVGVRVPNVMDRSAEVVKLILGMHQRHVEEMVEMFVLQIQGQTVGAIPQELVSECVVEETAEATVPQTQELIVDVPKTRTKLPKL